MEGNDIMREIFDEFAEYSNIDYRDNLSIGEVWSHVQAGESRDFGFVQKSSGVISEHERKKNDIDLIDKAKLEKSLPSLYLKKNAYHLSNSKLDEKKVSYIKFLLKKNTIRKVAEMYSVSQGTIGQIKRGCIWRHVMAATSVDNYEEIDPPQKKKSKYVKKKKMSIWERFGDGNACSINQNGIFARAETKNIEQRAAAIVRDNFTPWRESVDEILPDNIFRFVYFIGPQNGFKISEFEATYERVFCKGYSIEYSAKIIERIFKRDSILFQE